MNWPAYAVHEAHPICRQVARADEWAAQGTRFEGAAQNRRVYAVCDAAFLNLHSNLQGVPRASYTALGACWYPCGGRVHRY